MNSNELPRSARMGPPRKASKPYVLSLLRGTERIQPNTPDDVVFAALDILCAKGVLTLDDGHLDITGSSGATLKYHVDAAADLYSAIGTYCTNGGEGMELFLDFVFRILGPTGSGEVGIPDPSRVLEEAVDAVARFRWERGNLLNRYGSELRELGKVILKHVDDRLIARAEDLGYSSPARGGAETKSSLPESHLRLLDAVDSLGAIDEGTRKTAVEIGQSVDRESNDDRFKHNLSSLVKSGLLESKRGAAGGYWLTPKGIVHCRGDM